MQHSVPTIPDVTYEGKGYRLTMLGIQDRARISLFICILLCHCSAGVVAFAVRPSSSLLINQGRCRQDPTSIRLSTPADGDETTDYENEETLLKLHFSINDFVERGTAFQRLSKYCQSFPFAAVLPVQPLQYLPTDDGGVEVSFLRKKTKEKGSVDGGIRFFLYVEGQGIDLVAKRNSRGQSISKMFSEKLVVQSFIKRVTGEEVDKTSPPPTDVVTLSSVFHLWM